MTKDRKTEPLEGDFRLGNLEVKLAETAAEIDAAQALRYNVFYDEMGATPSEEVAAQKRDFDSLDSFCEHLLVIDHDKKGLESIVGTYRMTRREAAKAHGKFYSEDEFDITPLLNYPGEIMELGRSCINKDYRNATVMHLLWRGITAYLAKYDIKLMFGCASFHGINQEELALPLSFLYHNHLAPPALRATALPKLYTKMDAIPRDAFDPDTPFTSLDPRSGGNKLPPLIKGYLRVGAFVGDGAVIDAPFNTTDVCIIVKTELLTDRYIKHYERTSKRKKKEKAH